MPNISLRSRQAWKKRPVWRQLSQYWQNNLQTSVLGLFCDLFDPLHKDVVSSVTYRGCHLTTQCQSSMTWHYLTTCTAFPLSPLHRDTHTPPSNLSCPGHCQPPALRKGVMTGGEKVMRAGQESDEHREILARWQMIRRSFCLPK